MKQAHKATQYDNEPYEDNHPVMLFISSDKYQDMFDTQRSDVVCGLLQQVHLEPNITNINKLLRELDSLATQYVEEELNDEN